MMNWISDIDQLRADLDRRVDSFLESARSTLVAVGPSLEERFGTVAAMRSRLYEATNQLQHEFLLVRGLEWLRANGRAERVVKWGWHPSSTGPADEPDLMGIGTNGEVLISAEATTSVEPRGLIDGRMRHTLHKLSGMQGDRYYFIASAAMERRAITKLAKTKHVITVVKLAAPSVVARPQ